MPDTNWETLFFFFKSVWNFLSKSHSGLVNPAASRGVTGAIAPRLGRLLFLIPCPKTVRLSEVFHASC